MTDEEWFEFAAAGKPQVISVGRIEKFLCIAIGASTDLVQMRHDYARKILCKHGILPEQFRTISWTLACGIAFQDRSTDITFLHKIDDGWFHLTIKSNKTGTELWLKTFHRITASKVAAKLKSVKILRDQKS
jgi:hypothetical protein